MCLFLVIKSSAGVESQTFYQTTAKQKNHIVYSFYAVQWVCEITLYILPKLFPTIT